MIPLDCSFLPLPDGDSLARWGDPERTRREIARFSPRDAEVYPRVRPGDERASRASRKRADRRARPRSELAAPARSSRAWPAWAAPSTTSVATRCSCLLKLFTMSAVDFLDQWFESPVLKAPMSV